MIDSHALIYRNKKTMDMLGTRDKDLFTQIAAGTATLAEGAINVLLDCETHGINLNMGCPAKKVTGCGGGSNLLRHPEIIKSICQVVRKKMSVPFSVKFRSGWNSELINYPEIAKILEGEGVDYVMLHARTRAEAFSGHAHWDHIAHLKSILKIPVVGNGDVVCYESAKKMHQQTNCDGIAIGRGAIGNPWVYLQADRAMQGLPPLPEPTLHERYDVMVKHYQLIWDYYGSYLSSHIIRKHIVGYLKGLPGHKLIKEEIFSHEPLTPEILKNILGRYFFEELSGADPLSAAS